MRDHVDRIFAQWAVERPDLDRSAMAVLARILRASTIVERELERTFAGFAMNRGEFDVLATLRRAGEPYRLNPTDLSDTLLLSAGAMTNRLDRLEANRLIRRRPDPDDLRGVLVELTSRGRAMIDEVLSAHVANEERILAGLTPDERRRLTGLLRTLLVGLGDGEPASERAAG